MTPSAELVLVGTENIVSLPFLSVTVNRQKECWTLRLQDISPTRHFTYDMDTSPNGYFTYWTVRLRDISPTGHFAYSVDSSPTQCEHRRMGEGAGSPSNTNSPGLRPTSILHAKFHHDPSNRLASIHQRYRQDRQTTDR